jgi:DNA-directed RNA polymerase beta' subunit
MSNLVNDVIEEYDDEREISSIQFGLFSNEEIVKMSVANIKKTKLSTEHGCVYDIRMGSLDNNIKCETCNSFPKICPGHYGHIELCRPILHPLFYKRIVTLINLICIKCFRLIFTKEQLELKDILKYKGKNRFNKIVLNLKKIEECGHCENPIPEFKLVTNENNIYMIYKEDNEKLTVLLSVEEIKHTFSKIIDEDIELMGFNNSLMHPKNLIMENFIVIPPAARPYVISEGNICDDDLTNQILEIVKINNALAKELLPNNKVQKLIQSLKFRISTFFNNSNGKAKHSTNGRPIKGIKERLTGKSGLIRDHLMGKRCEKTGRTVIGPDPTLKINELAVPYEIAENLTIPVKVTTYNIKSLQNLVDKEQAKHLLRNNRKINLKYAMQDNGTKLEIGDVIIRNNERIDVLFFNQVLNEGDLLERKGVLLSDIKYPKKRNIPIQVGDIIERKLQDNDIVLLNRQPTLHAASMQAMNIIIKPHKTFRFNLSITKPFNADFDGDEMNIHVPQTLEGQTELKLLSSSEQQIISSQSSKPNMAIVQDSLLGAFKMTDGFNIIKKEQFFNIAIKTNLTLDNIISSIKHIRHVLKQKGKNPISFHGKGLISLILPRDFNYEFKNKGSQNEPILKIYRGVLYEGVLNKIVLGQSHNSLIRIIEKEYGSKEVCNFIDNIQFITNGWLLLKGFSIGIGDCVIEGEEQKKKIENVIHKCYIEAEGIKETTTHPNIREIRVTAALSKAKDIGLRIAKDSLSTENNFLSTVNSGSKGDFFNIAQITGLLGQQNLFGQRILPVLNNNTRTLPHYPFNDLPVELEYESKGFIKHSFIEGLNPKEFYFHAMTGREGICDTSMNTAKSGYIQRRIIKLAEDMIVHYDGSVRDNSGKIYQNAYGEDYIDPTKLVKVGKHKEFCDVSRVIDNLNFRYELLNKNK